ncbi:MAG: hypothetical protein ACRDIV_08115 [Ktedonobacteraceae bacterium]
MNVSNWFDDLPVVGALPLRDAAIKLREVGEVEAAESLEQAEQQQARRFDLGRRKGWWPFQDKAWQHTAHTFGYLAPASGGGDQIPIRHIEAISADPTLRNARVKITLNRLRVAGYPGGGTHRVLLHFFAQNQAQGRVEPVHFNATYRVQEGESAGVQGYPVFVGLGIGQEGLNVKCRTINVRNDQDEAFLKFLESDTFKAGLHLISTAQPVIAPFSEMALGLAKTIGARHRNISVQDFDLGLDFSTMPMRGRLAEGSYLAVQIPESFHSVWDWEEWVYLPDRGQIVKRHNHQALIPYNYLVFGVSRYEGQRHR